MREIGIYVLLTLFFLFAGLGLGYLLKKSENRRIREEKFQKEKEILESYNQKIGFAAGELKELEDTFRQVKDQTEEATNNFNNLTIVLKEAQERELKEYKESHLKEIQEEIQKTGELLTLNYQKEKEKYQVELKEILKELDNFKSARKTIIEEQKRQEEIQNNKNFYTIQISNSDKEDIVNLRKFAPLLHNPEILNKLIWSTYYQNPLKDLIGRVLGLDVKVSGIYKITCLNNKKAYIGKSSNVAERWRQHVKASLEIGNIAKNQLYALMKQEGAESFTFELLEKVEENKLLERESYWIKFYETDSYGLNMKG